MFLFTTSAPVRQREDVSSVPAVLRATAEESGVSFDYLLATAKRESGLAPKAQATTSSARGLFQFIEQTWLRMVRTRGAEAGLASEAQAISSRDGRLSVADSAERQRILALRDDPRIAARLAAELTRENHSSLATALARAPSQGELYIAHFLGAGAAAKLIRSAAETPDAKAAALFPAAAQANRSIFYSRDGAARSVSAVYQRLVAGFDASAPAAVASSEASQPQAPETGNPFHRLFRSSAQPVSSAVAAHFLPLGGRTMAPGAPLDIRPPVVSRSLRSRG